MYERFETWCGSKQYVVETLVEALYARRVISEDERGELLYEEETGG